MNAMRTRRVLALSGAALAFVVRVATAASPNTQQGQDPEIAIGQEVFNELKAKVEIVDSSPLYAALLPVIEPIMRAAQPQYDHPFKVYLVHEAQPNAFATPGGNIYVTDSLLFFVKNKQQLAGTLCHEVAHTIHHDSMALLAKRERLEKAELGTAILLGPTRAHLLAIGLLGELQSLGYSRDVESRADLTGADLCAAAGSNPWGLVWLFRDFDSAGTVAIPQLLSDHPNDRNRVDSLEQHFRSQPAVFGAFNPDPSSATPFAVDKKTPEVFLR